MPALAISMENIHKISKQKIKFCKFISDIAEANFTMTSHWKIILIYSTLCFPEP